MTESIMNTNALPEILLKLIPTDKVRVMEIDGEIRLIPLQESKEVSSINDLLIHPTLDTRGWTFNREEANER